nr:5-oxoprolinase subunit PxpB [Brevibacillus daliensis]
MKSVKSEVKLFPLGDSALLVQFSQEMDEWAHSQVQALASHLENRSFTGFIEYVPAFTSLTLFYDPYLVYKEHVREPNISPYEWVTTYVQNLLSNLEAEKREEPRMIEIPVCYGGEFGPDLGEVATHNGLTEEEVIQIHTSSTYNVYMIGFVPGFPYMGGMSQRIATPRRSSPRLAIPAGTVGIGGLQTGIYPLDSPGGWRLIGRTPVSLFLPDRFPPSLLAAGDQVRFRAISMEEYVAYQEEKR